MNSQFVLPILFCGLAIFGCKSPNRSQPAPVERPEQTIIVPSVLLPPPNSSNPPPVRSYSKRGSPDPVFDSYDSVLIATVKGRWESLLKDWKGSRESGQVEARFKLHADGRISDLAIVKTTLSPELAKLAQAVLADSAPFAPWPDKMKQMIDRDFREMTFKFDYY